jgi:hypothetical protein
MILSIRYPHVRELVEHYAIKLDDSRAAEILNKGLSSADDAEYLSYFIWKMIDQMAIDQQQNISVLGGVDNTSMLPDVSYEMTLLMDNAGYGDIWERILDED